MAAVLEAVRSANGYSHRLSTEAPLASPVPFSSSDTLKVLLTAKEGSKAKRPHQAFLILREPDSGLEAPFPLTVKENGKATVEIVRCASPHLRS
jgi:oligosaccharyltransferase complex subunit delta (ribophorin II)